MATSVTISPSVGNPILATQGGVGATPGFDAVDVRRMIEAVAAIHEGVLDWGAWKVSQNSGGANMTVDVAANGGLAVVQGDAIAFQSRYAVAPHSAVADLDIGANATGNPRLDQIVLQVRDNAHDGSGQNDARVMVLAGTATSGATLENRTGAASLPASALLLADILVASGAASITDAVIRDRRRWATGVMIADVSGVSTFDILVDSRVDQMLTLDFIGNISSLSRIAALPNGDGSSVYSLARDGSKELNNPAAAAIAAVGADNDNNGLRLAEVPDAAASGGMVFTSKALINLQSADADVGVQCIANAAVSSTTGSSNHVIEVQQLASIWQSQAVVYKITLSVSGVTGRVYARRS